MFISKYGRKFFEPDSNDDKKTAIMKKYYRDKDRIGRELLQVGEDIRDDFTEFNNKYEELKRMRSKTPLEQLEREYVIHNLLEEYK